jgi:hypothetical protein
MNLKLSPYYSDLLTSVPVVVKPSTGTTRSSLTRSQEGGLTKPKIGTKPKGSARLIK